MDLHLTESDRDTLKVAPIGDFDALGCKLIQERFDHIADSDTHQSILVDLHDVSFIDSSGIGAIVSLYKRLIIRNRDMEIINFHGQPKKLICLLRINKAITVKFADEAEAE